MNKRNKISRIVLGSVLAIIACSVEYSFWTSEDREPKTKILARGVVTDKKTIAYGCGKHGNSTCYDNYLTIDGKQFNVNSHDFVKTVIGSESTISITEREQITLGATFVFMLHTLICLFLGIGSLLIFGMFLYWVTSVDTDESFIEWFKRV